MHPLRHVHLQNGTNCYLIGTGEQRILLDTGDPVIKKAGQPVSDHARFIRNLKATLEKERCRISLIIISHLHYDHFGGVLGLLDTFGRHIPVAMLPAPRHHLTLWTIRELEKRGLVPVLQRGPRAFGPNEEFNFEQWMKASGRHGTLAAHITCSCIIPAHSRVATTPNHI